MNEKEVQQAEADFVKMALTVAMVMNQYNSAYQTLTRVPAALAGRAEDFQKIIDTMRGAIVSSRTGEEQEDALQSLEATEKVVKEILKIKSVADFDQIKVVLDLQMQQVNEMMAKDPKVQ